MIKLNAEQQLVVDDLTHSLLLQAPAGTGKTRVLAARIVHILKAKAASATEILCLTFTNRACKELAERIRLTAPTDGRQVVVKTIHSFCYSLIKEEAKRTSDTYHDFLIYDELDCKAVIAALPCCQGISERDLQALQNYLEAAKKYQLLPKLHLSFHFTGKIGEWLQLNGETLLEEYTAALATDHAVDFTDLILKAYVLLQEKDCQKRWQARFRFIAIDEMQDTSELEYRVISKLFARQPILLCGDYFQTIYEWRGSYPEKVIAAFRRDYQPREITFTINYRATQLLLHAAEDTLLHLFGRKRLKKVYAKPGTTFSPTPGSPLSLFAAPSYFKESIWIFNQLAALSETERLRSAILVRTNKDAQAMATIMKAHNQNLPPEKQLPLTSIDQFRLFKRQECKDVLAFLRLLIAPHDNLSLHRILLRFVSRIGAYTLKTIESPSYRKAGLTLTDFIDPAAQENGDPYGLLLAALQAERIVVFDVESTGTDTTSDEIIQLAAVRLDKAGAVKEKFNVYVQAKRSVGSSYYVHHISDEKLKKEGLPATKALPAFLSFAQDAVIVGHNVTYDLSILHSELRRLHLETKIFPYYDTLDLYRRFYPNLKNHKLENLSQRFPTGHQSSHDAYDDILATAGLLRYIIQEKIRPQTTERKAKFAIYRHLFTPFSQKMAAFRKNSYTDRPPMLIAKVMNELGVKHWYLSHEPGADGQKRLTNTRKLYRLAQENDQPERDSRDALTEFLKLTALSNSELDSLLKKQPQIPIITVHQAKGLEFDNVFLASLEDGVFPSHLALQEQHEEEEKRLFYVAITRAKRKLYLSYHQQSGQTVYQPSRFLAMIPEKYFLNPTQKAKD